MAGISHMPMALFVVATELSTEALNRKLQQTTFDGVAYLWLADSTSYSEAPQQRSDNRVNEGTYGPVNDFNSPFAGQTIEQVGDWIKHAPPEVDLDRRFFAVLDEYSDGDGTVQLCRIGDGESEGSRGKVQWFPVQPRGETFGYIQTGMFDSDLQGYRFKQERAGGPDRSSG